MTTQLRNRYDFFRAHAGYVVGRSAAGALDLARAEEVLDTAQYEGVASVEWFDDDLPYDQDIVSDEEAHALFASNELTGPYVCQVKIGDNVVGSLSGIVVGPRNLNDPYCRVVAAELASEVLNDLREAVSDALDSRTLCPAL